MKKFAGTVFFTACCVGVVFCLYLLIFERESIFYITLILPLLTVAIYYVVKTKFGSSTGFEKIELENEIIKKQIEKKELLAKLETLEQNE